MKRVPMDFDFPLNRSYADAKWREHKATCAKPVDEDGSCGCEWGDVVEPPAGDGWQLWQTVSDGPISPVFATADALVAWMSEPAPEHERDSRGGAYPSLPWSQGWSREAAQRLVRLGSAPSMMVVDGRVLSADEALASFEEMRDEVPS